MMTNEQLPADTNHQTIDRGPWKIMTNFTHTTGPLPPVNTQASSSQTIYLETFSKQELHLYRLITTYFNLPVN